MRVIDVPVEEISIPGWEINKDIKVDCPEYKFISKKATSLVLEENGAKIIATISKDRDEVIMHINPSEKDGIFFIGKFPFSIEVITDTADTTLQSNNISVNQLHEQFNSLVYFDENLNIKDKDVILQASTDEALRVKLILEMVFVNKLQTISRNFDWIQRNLQEGRLYHTSIFKKTITDPHAKTDEFGNIRGFGMKMTHREFDAYQQLHDELYKMELI